nr:DUF2142 domain-containing protein [Bifidobacterium vespertilionis]
MPGLASRARGLASLLRRVLHGLRAERAFLVLFLLQALPLALLLPPGAGLDEPGHAARVGQLAHMILAPRPVGQTPGGTVLYGGAVDAGLWRAMDRGLHQYWANDDPLPPPWDPSSPWHVPLGGGETGMVFSNTAVYAPAAYPAQILLEPLARLAGQWAGAGMYVTVLRLAGVSLFALAGFHAIRLAPLGRWALACVLCLPATAASMASVGADPAAAGSCLLLVSLALRMLDRGRASRGEWVLLAALAMWAGLAKMAYLPVALLACLPALLLESGSRRRGLTTAMLASALGPAVCWWLLVRGVNVGAMYGRATSPALQLQYALSRPWDMARMGVRVLLDAMPLPLGPEGVLAAPNRPSGLGSGGVSLLALIACLHTDHAGDPAGRDAGHGGLSRGRARRAVLACLPVSFLMTAALVCAADWLQFTPVGAAGIEGVQNRYWLPALPLILIPLQLAATPPADDAGHSKDDLNAEGDPVPATPARTGSPREGKPSPGALPATMLMGLSALATLNALRILAT